MIDFFLKKKEIIVDCFTDNPWVYNTAKPTYSNKIMPSWFKAMPKSYEVKNNFVGTYKEPTIKSCTGLVDYYKNSIVLPVWSDFILNVTPENYGYLFCQNSFSVEENFSKVTNHVFDDYHNVKFISPWHFKSKSDVNFLCVEPFWNTCTNFEKFKNFHIFSGCTNFKYVSAVNVNALINKTHARMEFSLGDPFMHIFPLSDKKIKIFTHLVTPQELQIIINPPAPAFFNRYKKLRKFANNE